MNRRQLWVAFWTIVTKEVVRFLRIWTQTILPPAITMGIYFVVFGRFLGDRIQDFGAFSYIEFIVPGLVMMSVITNSFTNVASSFFSAKFQRSVEEMLVSPIPDWLLVSAYVAGGTVRGILTGFVVLLVSLFFTNLQVHSLGLIVVFLVLTALTFSTAGFANGMMATKFDDIAIVPTFILTPLTYFGGVFYSIDLLPEFWRNLSRANPILYMVNGLRYGFLGVSDIPVVTGIVILVGFFVATFGLCLLLMKKGRGLRA
jgi:ABC-2 type transport system permease protein